MSHRYLIDPQSNVIVVRYWGVVNSNELDQVRVEIEADPLLKPGMNRVWDERDCDIKVTSQELAGLAQAWADNFALHGERKLAYLVNEDLSWGFNRVFEAHMDSEERSYQLFRDYGEAKAWLGLPADLADPRLLLPNN